MTQEKSFEEQIWDQLRLCYDYEIPVNIVELGLIYEVKLSELAGGGKEALVRMTFTIRCVRWGFDQEGCGAAR